MNKQIRWIIRKINGILPRRLLNEIYYFTADIADWLLGRREPLIPPRRIFTKDGCKDVLSYKKTGEACLKHLIELGGLKPNEKILDVGCGTGRIAVALTKYLDETGRYEGFDIAEAPINWSKKISVKHPNFHFQHVDIFNKRYNPKGKLKASELKFAFQDDFFDFVILNSVFTHMLPQDMENYIREITRVLKKGGRCFITFFLLNEESLQLVNAGKSHLNFKYDFGKYRTIGVDRPEVAVAYNEAFVLDLYERYGLKSTQPIRYGSWCGRTDFFIPRSLCSYSQDVILASKE